MLRMLPLSLLFAAAPALAAESEAPTVTEELDTNEPEFKMQICRPTIACLADLATPGLFEVEMGYGGRMSQGAFANSGQLLLKYTSTRGLQVQIGTNNVFLVGDGITPRSFDGVMPGLKWQINGQGKLLPSNALSAHVMFPTHGLDGASQRSIDLQVWWYLSKDIAFLHADFNLMLSVYDLAHTPIPQGLSTLALGFSLGHGFGFFTELYSTWGNAQAVALDGGSLNGFSWQPIDEVMFDIGGDIGLYQGTRSFSVFAGVSFTPNGRARVPIARRVVNTTNAVAMRGAP